MSRILILGGTGNTGRSIARHLLAHSDAAITLTSRHRENVAALAAELNQQYAGQRVSAVYADASDAQSLRNAFCDQTLVVIAAPTTAYVETVITTALATGVDYLDVQLGAKKFSILQSQADAIERAGRCFITEAGFHPGLPAALVRFAGVHMDTLVSAVTAGYLNMGSNLPYTDAFDELVEIFRDYRAQVFKDGHWTKPNSYQMRKIDFGADIGIKRCYSMFFEELEPLPRMYPSLQEIGFYISESHWVSDLVITPIVWMWLKIMPGAVRPIGKIIWWSMRTFHTPPDRVELQVQASGVRAGHPVTVHSSVAHPDGYELTAIPVVAALLQYLDGSARKPGMWMMGHLVDPVRLMKDMEMMGVRIKTTIH
jgi:hypothetical protein